MLLSAEDRTKFAKWCENEVASNKAIITQMQNMNLPESLIKEKRIETAACAVVFKMLSSVEEQTIERTQSNPPVSGGHPGSE
jgi:hypothetical protein